MSTTYILSAILVGAAVTLALRALPFLLFGPHHELPPRLTRLGALLPAAIIAVLIVYCLRGARNAPWHLGVPGVLAVLMVALTYRLFHNTFLSIISATALYMLLIRIM